MARGRVLLNRISASQKVNKLTDGQALLYSWLISHLDYNGNYYYDFWVCKGKIVPKRKKMTVNFVKKAFQKMRQVGLITTYKNGTDTFLHLEQFVELQPNLRPDRETPTEIPDINAPDSTPELIPDSTPDSTPEPTPREYNISKGNIKPPIPPKKMVSKKSQDNGVKLTPEQSIRFDLFWNVYSKKQNKEKARAAFKKLDPNDDLTKIIITNVKVRNKSDPQWTKNNGEFVPLPNTYLNNKRWADILNPSKDDSRYDF